MAKVVVKDESKVLSQRVSISFPRELYSLLAMIASEKKVSIAWVVREASEKYVADMWPLLDLESRDL